VFASKPQVEIGPDGTAVLSVTLEADRPETLSSQSFTVTLVDGERAVEASSQGKLQPLTDPTEQGLWAMLGVAFLGGLILNLMPCVFPVLSLKLLAFVNQDGTRLRAVRAGFGASAAGIVASFLVLASAWSS